jgi:hypothetical protein
MLKHLVGRVTPPADMMGAAKASLSENAFKDLMIETGGTPPTPEQLCKKADEARRASLPVSSIT